MSDIGALALWRMGVRAIASSSSSSGSCKIGTVISRNRLSTKPYAPILSSRARRKPKSDCETVSQVGTTAPRKAPVLKCLGQAQSKFGCPESVGPSVLLISNVAEGETWWKSGTTSCKFAICPIANCGCMCSPAMQVIGRNGHETRLTVKSTHARLLPAFKAFHYTNARSRACL